MIIQNQIRNKINVVIHVPLLYMVTGHLYTKINIKVQLRLNTIRNKIDKVTNEQ